MDWVENLNQAMNYIERHLTEKIDMEEISRITLCPIGIFQRFFVLATGITLAEYIRRRKLSCAAGELQEENAKVIDMAMKYGYETSDAFCTAFKRLYHMTPSQARKCALRLRGYHPAYFNLSVHYVKGEMDMILVNVDRYQYTEPLFEGARIVLNYLGEEYSPEYIQGISGAAFKIAGGCPSRPTCVYDRWTPDFLREIGWEIEEVPCERDGEIDGTRLIEAVKKQIDGGRPVLVWHAFTNYEWDVVCGYDEEEGQFIGRGSYLGLDDYARDSWFRPGKCEDVPAFGAILLKKREREFDRREAELSAIHRAVEHADRKAEEGQESFELEGTAFYRRWISEYSRPDKEKDAADSYCLQVYSSVRDAAGKFLREIAVKYDADRSEKMLRAAEYFDRETEILKSLEPYLGWNAPWGADEAKNRAAAELLCRAADEYEKGMGCLRVIIGVA